MDLLLFCPSVLAVNERHQQNVPFSCVNYSSVSSQMLLLTCTKLKEAVPLFLPPHIKWFFADTANSTENSFHSERAQCKWTWRDSTKSSHGASAM